MEHHKQLRLEQVLQTDVRRKGLVGPVVLCISIVGSLVFALLAAIDGLNSVPLQVASATLAPFGVLVYIMRRRILLLYEIIQDLAQKCEQVKDAT